MSEASSIPDEARLVERARRGDRGAVETLLEPWKKQLFGYVYRMVTHREDAEDLLQETLVRAIDQIRRFRGEAPFKTWLFGIATHVALDHLRKKKRWRFETQLEGEARARADPERMKEIVAMMSRPEFSFEIREHIAFCFSCVGRSLAPEEQAAIFLKEVLGFTAHEGASMLGCSEPQFRHRLSAARRSMIEAYDGMCQLINKTGACWQCRGLRELAPTAGQGPDLVQIEVAPGVRLTPESLFEARLEIVRAADLEEGRSRALHEDFFAAVSSAEEATPR
jgi:RNA polymerase sigma-70 factor, ECF subfamily